MTTSPLRPGDPRRLGDYRLLSRLGEGGMGTVFLGRDPGGRPVAVKAIRPEHANNAEFRARFRSEVQRARQVPSFCTAAVLDADPDDDTPYLVVEYVEGPSLQEVVEERGPMSPGDLHSIAVGVAAALTAIHGAGVIHRDLKPSNVLLSLGLPKVIDFGIARALEATTKYTRPGRWVGTVDYMAPERLDPDVGPVTPAADIFAWGGVIVFAGTGRNPFYGDTPVATAAQILTKAPELRGVPESLIDLVGHAFAKDPGDRPTANEVLQQLLAANAPQSDPRPRRTSGRFDARDLLEQVIAEGPRSTPATRSVPAIGPGPAINPTPVGRPAHISPAPISPTPISPVPISPAPVSPAPVTTRAERRRKAASKTPRRLTYAVGALMLASVAAATVAYARTTGDPPAAAIDPQTKIATATTSSLRGPSFSDPLRGPGRFRESHAESGSCTFADGQLLARVKGRSTYQCLGPDDAFTGDQSISVRVGLASADACAMVWFRYSGDRGYQLTACADQVELEELNGVLLNSLGKSTTGLEPGTPHELGIVISNQHAAVTIDGKGVVEGAVADPDLATGRIQLGVTNTGAGNAAEVSFADIDARTG
ncbi:serine/threonine protein kinase [Actinoplanes sp. NPDC051513]|uniref:serine/threonine protein kinase n=1 Tax=Actinoplanes sp. NPDC051513 TaxID=3363908 RepID=UPI0037908CDA